MMYSPVQNKPAPRFCLQNPEFLAYHAVLLRESYFANGNEVFKISEWYIDKYAIYVYLQKVANLGKSAF